MPAENVLEQVLRWQIEAGIDEAMGDAPVVRLDAVAPARPPAAAPPRPPPPAPTTRPLPSAADGVAAARDAAAAASSLVALREAVERFDLCSLKKTATRTVFADGNPASRLMFIGEAPGAEEDRIGLPFVGASGQLLDRMLAAIGLDRTSVYISNVIFWRPPGNRRPLDGELALCLPFVERHIALVQPHAVILVGGVASSALMPGSGGITRLRGRWLRLTVNGLAQPVEALAMYHPSFLLRSPDRKRETWADLLNIKSKLKEIAK